MTFFRLSACVGVGWTGGNLLGVLFPEEFCLESSDACEVDLAMSVLMVPSGLICRLNSCSKKQDQKKIMK